VHERDTFRARGRRNVNFHWRRAGLFHLNSIIDIRKPTNQKMNIANDNSVKFCAFLISIPTR
jgi:hypothetical protein